MKRLACGASLALAVATLALGQEEAAREVVLSGATIHPVVSGSPASLPAGTVILRGSRIQALGGARLEPGPGTERVDLSGLHLYPGLIDADTVLGLSEIESVTGTQDTDEVGRINPNLRAERAVNPDSELIPVTRTGGVLCANVAARTGLVAGTSALLRLSGWTYEDLTVRAPVLLHVRWPRMHVARVGRKSDEVERDLRAREEALATLRAAFREARAYARARALPGSTVPADPKWEAMLPFVAPAAGTAARPVAIHADALADLEAALDWGEREGLALVIVGGGDAWRLAPRLAARGIPVILGPTQRLPARAHDELEGPYAQAARLAAAGVRFAFSTGGSGFEAANARNLRLHAAQAIGQGLDPEVALRALTLDAARILGAADELGSLEVGKSATLFATDRPLWDDRAVVTHAWIDGRPVDLRDRQVRLYERYRARRRQ